MWKSEVIGPVVIVVTGSGSHAGPFRVNGMGSTVKQTNYRYMICFIQKPNSMIRVLNGLSIVSTASPQFPFCQDCQWTKIIKSSIFSSTSTYKPISGYDPRH